VAKRVVSLEEIEHQIEQRLGLSYTEAIRMTSMMRPSYMRTKLGKRPVGKNIDAVLKRSPGSSTHSGLDFVKAVYAERTGQEPLY